LRPTISTTATAWKRHRATVEATGELVAEMAAHYLATGDLPHRRGFHVRGTTATSFSFDLADDCLGPHDPSCLSGSGKTIRMVAPAAHLSVTEMLDAVGMGAAYADRALAWTWHCPECGNAVGRLHVTCPPRRCSGCDGLMVPSVEQASGLTVDDIADLGGDVTGTLAELGLGSETLVRCATSAGEITWIELEELYDGPT
jgi:hypothetical protein